MWIGYYASRPKTGRGVLGGVRGEQPMAGSVWPTTGVVSGPSSPSHRDGWQESKTVGVAPERPLSCVGRCGSLQGKRWTGGEEHGQGRWAAGLRAPEWA